MRAIPLSKLSASGFKSEFSETQSAKDNDVSSKQVEQIVLDDSTAIESMKEVMAEENRSIRTFKIFLKLQLGILGSSLFGGWDTSIMSLVISHYLSVIVVGSLFLHFRILGLKGYFDLLFVHKKTSAIVYLSLK